MSLLDFEISELVPTGSLRAAVNVANAALVRVDERTGELMGPSIDLANALAAEIDCPLVVNPYPSAAAILAAAEGNDWDIAHRELKRVGLGGRLTHYPSQLSGGQQQRVAIARALALGPKVMLLDEPTSALDPQLVEEILQAMMDMKKEGMTMLVVSHEMRFARDAADRIAFMEAGQIVETGSPGEILARGPDSRACQFLSHGY
jgi:ABC-type polar amino acid transport system ATPase subunit